MKIGYFLSSEEYSPGQLIDQARLAEEAGFDALWISDHYHPWNDAQGQSSFVWSMIGAIVLGVGCGEALNEHVTTSRWPNIDVRLDMLEEAVAIMRELWSGDYVT